MAAALDWREARDWLLRLGVLRKDHACVKVRTLSTARGVGGVVGARGGA